MELEKELGREPLERAGGIFLEGVCAHVRRRFGFGDDLVPMESSCVGPVTTALAFTAGGVGWEWSLDDDEIARAPQFDEPEDEEWRRFSAAITSAWNDDGRGTR